MAKYDDVYRLKLQLLIEQELPKVKAFFNKINAMGVGRGGKGGMQFISREETIKQGKALVNNLVPALQKVKNKAVEINQSTLTLGQRLGFAIKQAFSLELAFRRVSFVMVATFSYKVWYGFLRGMADVFKSAVRFESIMTKVSTMLEKKTMPLLDKFAANIRVTAVLYGESIKVLGDTLYDVLSARIPPGWALTVMEESAKLAKAGFTDTKTALKPLLTLMKSYKGTIEDVTKYSNLLTTTVVHGRFTFEELAEQIGKVIPQAAILGISAEKVSAAFAVVTQQLGNTRESATALRRLMLVFAKDNDKLNDIAANYGVTLSDLVERHDGFAYVMGKLLDATNKEKIAIAGSVRAFSAFASIASDTEGYMRALNDMMGDTYTTQDKLNDVMDDAAVKVDQLKATWTEFALSFNNYVLPIIKTGLHIVNMFLSGVGGMVDAFLGLPGAIVDAVKRARKETKLDKIWDDETLKIKLPEVEIIWTPEGPKLVKEFVSKIDEELVKELKEKGRFRKAAELLREAFGVVPIRKRPPIEPPSLKGISITPETFEDTFKVLNKIREAEVDIVEVQKEIDDAWKAVILNRKKILLLAEESVVVAKEKLELAKKEKEGVKEAELVVERAVEKEISLKRELQLYETRWRLDKEKQEEKVAKRDLDILTEREKKEAYVIARRISVMEEGIQKEIKIINERLRLELLIADRTLKDDKRLEAARAHIRQTATNALKAAWEKRGKEEIQSAQKVKDALIQVEKDKLSLVLIQYDLKTVKIEDVTAAQVEYIEKIKVLGVDEIEVLKAQKAALSIYKKEWKELLELGVVEKGTSFVVYLESIRSKIIDAVPDIDKFIAKSRESKAESKTLIERIEEYGSKINDVINRFANMWSQYTQLRISQARAESDAVISKLDSQEEAEIAYAERIGMGTDKIRKKYSKLRDVEEEKARKKAEKIRKAQKPIMIAQSIADTALAVVRALQTKPTWLGIALAATVGAIGIAQTAIISVQKFAKGGIAKVKRAFGGLIPGSGTTDSIIAQLTPGEFVINPKATAQFYPLLDAINNFKPVSVPSITPSYAGGGVVTNNIFDDRLFEEFKEMKEAFQDIGFEEMKDGDYGHFVRKGVKYNRKAVFS